MQMGQQFYGQSLMSGQANSSGSMAGAFSDFNKSPFFVR
jgi:hypothetical protein